MRLGASFYVRWGEVPELAVCAGPSVGGAEDEGRPGPPQTGERRWLGERLRHQTQGALERGWLPHPQADLGLQVPLGLAGAQRARGAVPARQRCARSWGYAGSFCQHGGCAGRPGPKLVEAVGDKGVTGRTLQGPLVHGLGKQTSVGSGGSHVQPERGPGWGSGLESLKGQGSTGQAETQAHT